MRTHALLAPVCALVACAAISGTQTFETTRRFTLPDLGAFSSEAGPQTIRAVGAAGETSFAESVLADVEALRERDHVDSAEVSVRIIEIRLSTDTTFAGVTAVRVHLVTASGAIALCSRTLTPDEQRASSLRCEADQVLDEATPAEISAELVVSGAVTAKRLDSVVAFEVEVDVDASL